MIAGKEKIYNTFLLYSAFLFSISIGNASGDIFYDNYKAANPNTYIPKIETLASKKCLYKQKNFGSFFTSFFKLKLNFSHNYILFRHIITSFNSDIEQTFKHLLAHQPVILVFFYRQFYPFPKKDEKYFY